jgi:lysozyme family protein
VADFIPAITYCLQNEGGFSDRPEDSGGPTNKGITKTMLAKFKGRMVSTEELQHLGDNVIKAFYEQLFWTPLRISGLSQSKATAILDTAINQGEGAAIKLAQEAVGPTLIADGVPGPETLSAIDKMSEKDFIHNYVGLIQDKYAKICMNASNQIIFLEGWLRRSRRLFLLLP